jgi:hypothetical protein
LRSLLFERLGDLLFEIRIGVDDVPARAHVAIPCEIGKSGAARRLMG